MPLYRITIVFEKSTGDPVGHTERWDFSFGSDTEAVTLARQIAARRAQFLPFDWKMLTIRVGKLTAFERADETWRFKQTSVAICIPPTAKGTQGAGEIDGGAVYYRFMYSQAPGKPAVRLFTPVYEDWWDGSASGGRTSQVKADGEIQPWVRYLKTKGHVLARINPTTGSTSTFSLDCATFQRAAIKKVGRPFGQRRGRRFAHRTHRP